MPDAISGLGAVSQPVLHGSVDQAMSALGGLDSDGFLKLLVAQLRYQSPLEPSDPSDLMLQTSTLAQLDATQQMLRLQQEELGMQQAVVAASLLGTSVSAIGPDETVIEGTVDAVRYTALGPVLDVDGHEVQLGAVTELRTAPSAPPAPDGLATTQPFGGLATTPSVDGLAVAD